MNRHSFDFAMHTVLILAAIGCMASAVQAQSKLAIQPRDGSTLSELRKNLTVGLGGGVTMQFVLIQSGAFTMGERESAHKVTISKPFYLGTYEVTSEQWQAVMGTSPSSIKAAKNPVETVSWNDCQIFLRKLAEKVTGKTFRLPTEAEWEYACRAGSTTKYCYGDRDEQLSEYAWYNGNSGRLAHPVDKKKLSAREAEFQYSLMIAHPVGEKKPNAWGVYDMHGNVWEWCEDLYQPDKEWRVLRGGACNSFAGECRSASRVGSGSSARSNRCGLRTVIEAR